MKKIISILSLLFVFATNSFSQLTNAQVDALWSNRQVPLTANRMLTWGSFVNKQTDGTPWYTIGNTVGSNTAFIGTLDNRSLYRKTNGIIWEKLDSIGIARSYSTAATSTVIGSHYFTGTTYLINNNIALTSNSLAPGYYQRVENTGNQLPFVMASGSLGNSQIDLKGMNNSAINLTDTVNSKSYRFGLSCGTAGMIDYGFIGINSNPATSTMAFDQTNMYAFTRLRHYIGAVASVTPTALLHIASSGSASVPQMQLNSSTQYTGTSNGALWYNSTSSGFHFLGSAKITNTTVASVPENTTALGVLRIGQGTSWLDIGERTAGSLAVWANQTTNTTSNYAAIFGTSTSVLNGSAAANLQVGGSNILTTSSAGISVTGTGTCSSSFTASILNATNGTNTGVLGADGSGAYFGSVNASNLRFVTTNGVICSMAMGTNSLVGLGGNITNFSTMAGGVVTVGQSTFSSTGDLSFTGGNHTIFGSNAITLQAAAGSNVNLNAGTSGGITNFQIAGTSRGNVSLGGAYFGFTGVITASAALHIGAGGTTTANTAPLKLAVAGSSLLATPETGAVEVNTSGTLFYTPASTRYELSTILKGSATLDFPNTLTQISSDLTITVTGAADGDPVMVGVPNGSVQDNTSYTAWVSSANTVTVRFSNHSASSHDPASGTFKVVVNKN